MDKEKKIKSGIYYPKRLYRALKRVYAEDSKNRKYNDIVIEIIEEHPKIQAMLKKMAKEGGKN